MTNEEVAAFMTEAGHFPQIRELGPDEYGVETARRRDLNGTYLAPLIKTYKDRKGRWVLTVFGESYFQVPNENDVPAATLDMLRAMDRSMDFSPVVIQRYGLVELDLKEFEIDNE